MVVVDTNVILHLVLRSDQAAESGQVYRRDPDWVAPALWRSELRSAVSLAVRHRGLSMRAALEAVAQARRLVRRVYFPADAEVLQLAAESGCTTYDCEFVALARASASRLVTSDRQVLEAFPELAVTPAGFAALP